VTEALRLSVVAPVYDERDNLEPLVRELTAALEPLGPYEILLVDDGSTDGSGDRIAELARHYPRTVRGLHFRENRGQTAAFDAGFRAARGSIVVTIDADLQNDPHDIERLVIALAQADVAVGYRLRRSDPWLRRVSATIANAVRNRATGDDIKDTGCSLKAFRRECLAGLRLYAGLHRFLPTLLRMDGWRVVQLPVEHRPRASGASKYGVWNRLVPALADLLAVRWMRRRRLDYEVVRHDP
jgi:glycosyltransferase involved in cell wall biosynthesis